PNGSRKKGCGDRPSYGAASTEIGNCKLTPCHLWDDRGWKAAGEHASAGDVRRVVRCDCWRDSIGRLRLAEANIPKRYQHCTLANFTAYNESLEHAVAKARRVAESFPASTKGLLLEGQPGVGK